MIEGEQQPGALPAEADNIDALVGRLSHPAAEIAVYCWSETCSASAQVSTELLRRGYTNVRRYVQGKRDWLQAGLPIETDGERGDGGGSPESTRQRDMEGHDES